jgi:hypothetical protein
MYLPFHVLALCMLVMYHALCSESCLFYLTVYNYLFIVLRERRSMHTLAIPRVHDIGGRVPSFRLPHRLWSKRNS